MAYTVDQFMDAISGQESGGDYGAENPDSGAYGRFQIMPANWPSWSAEAGIPGAPQSAANQDRVARFKMQQYYNQTGSWEDVASMWYSGQPRSEVNLTRRQGENGEYPSIGEYIDHNHWRVGATHGRTHPSPRRYCNTRGRLSHSNRIWRYVVRG